MALLPMTLLPMLVPPALLHLGIEVAPAHQVGQYMMQDVTPLSVGWSLLSIAIWIYGSLVFLSAMSL